MFEFGIVLIIFALIALVIYSPAIFQYFAWKRTTREFERELSELDTLYNSSRIVITEPLGEGTSQNSDVKFAAAHQNQSFAMNTIMEVLSQISEE